MSYVTVEVEIDHGRIIPREPQKVPDSCKALLVIVDPVEQERSPGKMTPLEAFRALQEHLNLDEAKAKAWMDTIRDARR